MQASHWPTRSKKARVYKQPVILFIFNTTSAEASVVKGYRLPLLFSHACMLGEAFFFSGFFFVEMVLIELYTMA